MCVCVRELDYLHLLILYSMTYGRLHQGYATVQLEEDKTIPIIRSQTLKQVSTLANRTQAH